MSQEDKSSLTEENASKNRWTSSLYFIMAMAGVAAGMGNLCRFPTMVGQHGGGAFVLVYLVCIFLSLLYGHYGGNCN